MNAFIFKNTNSRSHNKYILRVEEKYTDKNMQAIKKISEIGTTWADALAPFNDHDVDFTLLDKIEKQIINDASNGLCRLNWANPEIPLYDAENRDYNAPSIEAFVEMLSLAIARDMKTNALRVAIVDYDDMTDEQILYDYLKWSGNTGNPVKLTVMHFDADDGVEILGNFQNNKKDKLNLKWRKRTGLNMTDIINIERGDFLGIATAEDMGEYLYTLVPEYLKGVTLDDIQKSFFSGYKNGDYNPYKINVFFEFVRFTRNTIYSDKQ